MGDNKHIPGKDFTLEFNPVTGRLRADFSKAAKVVDLTGDDTKEIFHMNYKWGMPKTRVANKTACDSVPNAPGGVTGKIEDLTPYHVDAFKLNQREPTRYELDTGYDTCY